MLENGSMGPADVAAVVGNANGGMNGFGGGWFWIVILFLFAMFGNNGWNNGGNCGNGQPVVIAGPGLGGGDNYRTVQQIIDQQTLQNGQQNLGTQMNNIAMAQQNCCCENRAAIADLKYTVATENCEDRNQLQLGIRDVMNNDNANYQKIMDKMCQLEMDNMRQNYEAQIRGLNQQIAALQDQNQRQLFQASQIAQTADLKADNSAQTLALENYLDPPVRPSYIVPNPNGCTPTYYQGGWCGRRVA